MDIFLSALLSNQKQIDECLRNLFGNSYYLGSLMLQCVSEILQL